MFAKKRKSQDIEITSNLSSLERHNVVLHQLKGQTTNLLMGLGGLSLAFISMGAYIHRSMQSTIQPYIVTVDSHGVVLGSKAVAQQIPQSLIIEQICDFIRNLRLVSLDKQVQQDAIMKAYAFIRPGSTTANYLNNFYQQNNPFAKQNQSSRKIQIVNALPNGQNSLQIDWNEQDFNQEQNLIKSQKMRALVSWSLTTTSVNDSDSLLLNPLGLCIENLEIAPVIN